MKSDWSHLEPFRKLDGPMGSRPGDKHGAFVIQRGTFNFVIIASMDWEDEKQGLGWEHVSMRVDTYHGQRVPTWAEMCRLKDLFFEDEEAVVQFHPPKSEYVNCHPHVLHLWKPVGRLLERPDPNFVGPK